MAPVTVDVKTGPQQIVQRMYLAYVFVRLAFKPLIGLYGRLHLIPSLDFWIVQSKKLSVIDKRLCFFIKAEHGF